MKENLKFVKCCVTHIPINSTIDLCALRFLNDDKNCTQDIWSYTINEKYHRKAIKCIRKQ